MFFSLVPHRYSILLWEKCSNVNVKRFWKLSRASFMTKKIFISHWKKTDSNPHPHQEMAELSAEPPILLEAHTLTMPERIAWDCGKFCFGTLKSKVSLSPQLCHCVPGHNRSFCLGEASTVQSCMCQQSWNFTHQEKWTRTMQTFMLWGNQRTQKMLHSSEEFETTPVLLTIPLCCLCSLLNDRCRQNVCSFVCAHFISQKFDDVNIQVPSHRMRISVRMWILA